MHLLLVWNFIPVWGNGSNGATVPFWFRDSTAKQHRIEKLEDFWEKKHLAFVGCKLFSVLVKCCVGQMCDQAPVYQDGFSQVVDILISLIGLPLLFSDGSWINNQAIKAQGWQLFVEYVEKAKHHDRWVDKVGRHLQCLCCCMKCHRYDGTSGQKRIKNTQASKQTADGVCFQTKFKLAHPAIWILDMSRMKMFERCIPSLKTALFLQVLFAQGFALGSCFNA